MIKKQGFTLVELLLGLLVASIIFWTSSMLLTSYTAFFKDVIKKSSVVLDTNICLKHIADNIQRSAWVKVIDENTIELHSHSDQSIKKYILKNENIEYIEAIPPIPSQNVQASILAKSIRANRIFSGVGQKRDGNSYSMVKIEFWHKDFPRDIAYTAISTNESSNLVFLGSSNTNYEDGTKNFPYKDLNNALAACHEGQDEFYPFYQAATSENLNTFLLYDLIIVSSGTHVLNARVNVNPYINIGFCNNSNTTLSPGLVFALGKACRLTFSGEFTCQGNASSKIYFQPSSSWQDYDDNWDSISVINQSPSLRNYSFNGLDISGANKGLLIRGVNGTGWTHLSLKNCFIHNSAGLYAENVFNVTLTNNVFLDNVKYFLTGTSFSYGLGTIVNNYKSYGNGINFHDAHYTPRSIWVSNPPYFNGARTFTVEKNSFYSSPPIHNVEHTDIGFLATSGSDKSFYINNNLFAFTETSINLSDSSLSLKNNRFSDSTFSINSQSNNVTIANNSFISTIYMTGVLLSSKPLYPSSSSYSMIFTNNKIVGMSTASLESSFGLYSMTNAIIKNCYFENVNLTSYPDICPVVHNSVFVDCNTNSITSPAFGHFDFTCTNCTFIAPAGSIKKFTLSSAQRNKNCIFKNITFKYAWYNNLFKYCDIYPSNSPYLDLNSANKILGDPTNMSKDPLLTNDYRLQGSSPCKGKGESGVDMGAYGGKYKNDWSAGIGAPATGVGAS